MDKYDVEYRMYSLKSICILIDYNTQKQYFQQFPPLCFPPVV
jgi:hypothetical protein